MPYRNCYWCSVRVHVGRSVVVTRLVVAQKIVGSNPIGQPRLASIKVMHWTFNPENLDRYQGGVLDWRIVKRGELCQMK